VLYWVRLQPHLDKVWQIKSRKTPKQQRAWSNSPGMPKFARYMHAGTPAYYYTMVIIIKA
jgi:hypothetical protein